jgi:hypothetical protein
MNSSPPGRVARLPLAALISALLVILAGGSALAQGKQSPPNTCWQRPDPETLEEALRTSGNRARARKAQGERGEPAKAVLLISNGAQKLAYSAGLLVGWGETGNRPRFAAITAVGPSALIAPFAFISFAGDQAIADFFHCQAGSLSDMAERAALSLDDSVLAAIAREHETGRRLYIALPGSAARPESVWDFGLLATSGHPDALALARDVLRAAIGPYKSVDPGGELRNVMQAVPKNPVFRQPGTGEEFLFPAQLATLSGEGTRYFLIHNGSVFEHESTAYIRARNAKPRPDRVAALVPGYDVVQHATTAKGGFLYASTKNVPGLLPQSEFDLIYYKALFRHAYRHARMGEEWTREFPGLPLPARRSKTGRQ